MINEAIDKVSKEISEIKQPYGERLGTYIITDLLDSEENAEKVLVTAKSLKECYDAIKNKARDFAVNNCAMVDAETVYGWLREYYGIGSITTTPADIKELEKTPEAFNKVLSLTDFM